MKANKTKIAIVSLLLILLVGAFSTNVKADTSHSFNVAVTPTEVTVKPGETVTINVSVTDINMGDEGINTLEGVIKYDKNVLEEITSSSVQSFNNWSTTYNDGSSSLNGKFLAVKLSSGEKQNTKVLSVTFKVKENLEKGVTTQVDFTDLTSNDGTDLIKTASKKVGINVVKEGQPIVNEIVNEVANEETNGAVNEESKPTNKQELTVNKPQTQAPGKIPQTGVTRTLVNVIIIIAVVGVIIGIRYKNMKDVK